MGDSNRDILDLDFAFTLDPCASAENAKGKKFYTIGPNDLAQDWSNETVFMNPPYGDEIPKWRRKAFQESLRGAVVVCLVPSRTDTRWWHKYAMRGEIRFFSKRLLFVGAKKDASFPSALVIFRPPEFRRLAQAV